MTSSYADPTCALDDHPQPRQSRLRRDLRIEHTVYTSDGVCLAVRDYQPTTAVQHTVVLLHGLCLTYTSWHNQIRRLQRQPRSNRPTGRALIGSPARKRRSSSATSRALS